MEDRKLNRALIWVGLLFTLGYVVLVAVMVDNRYSELQELKLNEVGDFLAGVFGPLTIVWLILGFLQQGMELRQNNEALKLQAQELQNSVEQQKELVLVTKQQAEAMEEDRNHRLVQSVQALQPRFVVTYGGTSLSSNMVSAKLNLRIENKGEVAFRVSAEFSGALEKSSRKFPTVGRDAVVELPFLFDPVNLPKETLKIFYEDSQRNPGVFTYFVEVSLVNSSYKVKVDEIG